MRTSLTALAAAGAVAAVACGGTDRPAAAPRDDDRPAAATNRLLEFSYDPAEQGAPATRVSIWFAGDAAGNLLAMRSSRVAGTGKLLQESAFVRGASYSIVDHGSCTRDSDVQMPSDATVTGLLSDSIGPLEARRPKAELNDGQVLMRIDQPTADLGSRVVTLVDVALGRPMARLDRISLREVPEADVRAPLAPLACTPPPAPAG